MQPGDIVPFEQGGEQTPAVVMRINADGTLDLSVLQTTHRRVVVGRGDRSVPLGPAPRIPMIAASFMDATAWQAGKSSPITQSAEPAPYPFGVPDGRDDSAGLNETFSQGTPEPDLEPK